MAKKPRPQDDVGAAETTELFANAVRLHQAGRLQEAEQHYRQVLARDPRHADTPGGVALRTALGAQPEPGFPWLVITDENGKPLVNSNRNGKIDGNVGYPAAPEEIDWYIEMLKRAAPALSASDLAATRTWLKQHAPH